MPDSFIPSLGRRRFLTRSSTAATALAALAAGVDTVAGRTPIPFVSTRGHFTDEGALTDGHTLTDYETKGPVPGIGRSCVSDLSVFVGGWRRSDDGDADAAIEDALATERSLAGSGYPGTVIGYSWDDDLGGGADFGWRESARIAERNGPKLAAFLAEYLANCSGRVRLIGHSLGARIVFRALETLETNGDRPLASVHLFGAAVDDERPTDRSVSYDALRTQVGATFNYLSRTDAVLGWAYPPFEFDRALGQYGAEQGPDVPDTYFDVDVTSEVGSDHAGYTEHVADEVVAHMRLVSDGGDSDA